MLLQMNITKVLLYGRGPSLKDVCIDTAGVIFGIVIVLIIVSVFKTLFMEKRPQKKKKDIEEVEKVEEK